MRLIEPFPASVSIGRSRQHQRVYLVGKTCGDHRGHPATLAEPYKVYPAAEIVDRYNDLGEVVVDLQILHILRGRLPVGQSHMVDAVGQESLHQALTVMIVGDHGGMASMRRVDQRRDPDGLSIIAQHHGPQIKAHLVRRRKAGLSSPWILISSSTNLRFFA